jgi:hypothetical protein
MVTDFLSWTVYLRRQGNLSLVRLELEKEYVRAVTGFESVVEIL